MKIDFISVILKHLNLSCFVTRRGTLIFFCLRSLFNAAYAVEVQTDNAFSFWSTILPDTSRKSRQKTRTVAKTTNPVFNHTMVYDGFRPEDLKEACIELTVWDHNKLANHFLGGLRIGLGTGTGQLTDEFLIYKLHLFFFLSHFPFYLFSFCKDNWKAFQPFIYQRVDSVNNLFIVTDSKM